MWALDLLGIARYQKVAVKTFPRGWGLGAFANAFGDSSGAVQSVLGTGRCAFVRIHLIWSDTHNFGDADIPMIKKLATKWNGIAAKYPDVCFYLSPFCEHNLANPDKYLKIVQEHAPECRPVNTPMNGKLSSTFVNEVHGSHKLKGVSFYSYDGSPCVDADVATKADQTKDFTAHFFWTSQFNGRKNPNDDTPRPQREAWPTADLINSVIYLSTPKGETKLPKGWLWKSHADQHNAPKPEPRALKPVLISPNKVKRFELRTDDDKLVGVLPYFGPFNGGGHRYYLDSFGYDAAEKAVSLSGNPVVNLVTGSGGVIGKVNPAFRENAYRW